MLLKIPEACVFIYSFLLNLAWETIQAPLFVFEQQSSFPALTGCLLLCSGVDALMTLIVFWSVAVAQRDRLGFLKQKATDWISFVALGLFLAVLSEYTAIHYRNLWEYSGLMPVIPGLNIDLVPVVQWLLLPPIALLLTSYKFVSHKRN